MFIDHYWEQIRVGSVQITLPLMEAETVSKPNHDTFNMGILKAKDEICFRIALLCRSSGH